MMNQPRMTNENPKLVGKSKNSKTLIVKKRPLHWIGQDVLIDEQFLRDKIVKAAPLLNVTLFYKYFRISCTLTE